MKKILKSPKWLLPICMAVVLVFSVLANLVNTSAYSVDVKLETFETNNNNGKMEALIYTPKGCDKDNPCPVIVTTHGYLNSKEMQDAPAIELSRRGYIVVAVDMYDHGGSTWDTPYEFGFFAQAMSDAATWVHKQPWALKDAKGNGMIAVSGHSMGGFSTELAVAFDEISYMFGAGHRKIAVSLSVGADYRYSQSALDTVVEAMGLPFEIDIKTLFATRSSGMIIAHYDEFFGDDYKLGDNTVAYKDYVKTEEGKAFLGDVNKDYDAGVIYEHDGGQRVIYTPNETHPWNHFSTETTSYMIEFYDEAFAYQLAEHGLTNKFTPEEKGGQTWWLKEAFEFIALIGLLGATIPAFNLLMKVPFFAKVRSEEEVVEETTENEEKVEKKKVGRVALVVTAIITSLIPAYYFPTFIDREHGNFAIFTSLSEAIMWIAMIVVLGAWIFYFAYRMINSEKDYANVKSIAWSTTKGALVVSAASLFLRHLANNAKNIVKTGYYYNAPTASDIGFWALISAAISLLVIVIVHYVYKKRNGATAASYGVKATIKQIALALLISVILFVGIYLVVFLIGWLLNVDFRLWVYAVKSFKWHHFVSFLRYVPVYFVFYFINSIVVTANTKDVKGWKGTLYAMFLNAGGLVLFLAYQYGKLFLTGTAAVPSLALPGILLFGLVPSLALAAVFARKFYEKTNNVWTSAFFNTFLFTMIAIANTAVYLLAM